MKTRTRQTRFRLAKIIGVLTVLSCCYATFAATAGMVAGNISDALGKPIADATVIVYHAGPTKGYSLFCPSCYADCGKRAITDSNGKFRFDHLNPDLRFELLVAKVGYEPKFIEKVLPTSELSINATLDARPKVIDPSRMFRGRIVDSNGLAQRDAVVQSVATLWNTKTGAHALYGPVPGLDPIAVTDQQGTFEIESSSANQNRTPSVSGAPLKILVSVEARGKAQAFSVVPAGLDSQTITVTDGAFVRGRLVRDGRPVGSAEVGLIGQPRGGWGDKFEMVGNPYGEIRIGTGPDGRFEITNVPVSENWYVYAKMESVAALGASGNVSCSTRRNDEVVDIGDLQLKPAYHFRGRVVLSDGKPIASGMTLTITSEKAFDSQTTTLPSSGIFEFGGLAAGSYSILSSVKGYSPLRPAPISSKAENGRVVTYTPISPIVSIEKDVDNFVLTLHPNGLDSEKRN